MLKKTTMQDHGRTLKWTDEAAEIVPRRSLRLTTVLGRTGIIVMAIMSVGQVWGQSITKTDFTFINAADTTQGFLSFGSMPAINNAGAVAFQSLGAGFESGAVLRWQYGGLTPIATSADKVLTGFGDSVAINSSGTVGFSAKVSGTSD